MSQPVSTTTHVYYNPHPNFERNLVYLPDVNLAITSEYKIVPYRDNAYLKNRDLKQITVPSEQVERIQQIFNKTQELNTALEMFLDPTFTLNKESYPKDTDGYLYSYAHRIKLHLPSLQLTVIFITQRIIEQTLPCTSNNHITPVTVSSEYLQRVKEMYAMQKQLDILVQQHFWPFLRNLRAKL